MCSNSDLCFGEIGYLISNKEKSLEALLTSYPSRGSLLARTQVSISLRAKSYILLATSYYEYPPDPID